MICYGECATELDEIIPPSFPSSGDYPGAEDILSFRTERYDFFIFIDYGYEVEYGIPLNSLRTYSLSTLTWAFSRRQ